MLLFGVFFINFCNDWRRCCVAMISGLYFMKVFLLYKLLIFFFVVCCLVVLCLVMVCGWFWFKLYLWWLIIFRRFLWIRLGFGIVVLVCCLVVYLLVIKFISVCDFSMVFLVWINMVCIELVVGVWIMCFIFMVFKIRRGLFCLIWLFFVIMSFIM